MQHFTFIKMFNLCGIFDIKFMLGLKPSTNMYKFKVSVYVSMLKHMHPGIRILITSEDKI